MTDFYTGRGDDGSTGVLAKGRVSKDDPIIAAIGDVDELNSAIGVAIFYIRDESMRKELKLMQNELFILGADLTSIGEKKVKKLEKEHVKRIEQAIERINKQMPQLKQFVIPGGSEAAVHLQLARSIARRAERSIVASSKKYKIDPVALEYINRASSFLFAAAIYLNDAEGIEEDHPTY